MVSKTTKDPAGNTWRVGRKLLPWNVRLRKRRRKKNGDGWEDTFSEGVSALSFEAILDLGGWGIAVLIVGAILVLIFPVLLLALELILAIVVLFVVVVGGFILRRPWLIFARRARPKSEQNGGSQTAESSNGHIDPHDGVTFGIRGFRKSRVALDDLKLAIEEGTPLGELEEKVRARATH
jgi:hypothetical protein